MEWNPTSRMPNKDDSVEMTAMLEDEAFQICNSCVYRIGFSVQYNKIRYKAGAKDRDIHATILLLERREEEDERKKL